MNDDGLPPGHQAIKPEPEATEWNRSHHPGVLNNKVFLYTTLPVILIMIPAMRVVTSGWDFTNIAGTTYRLVLMAAGVGLWVYGRTKKPS